MNRWILPLNIALSFLVIAAVAFITAQLLSHRIAGLFTKPVTQRTAGAGPPAGGSDLQSFAVILEKGLFGRATVGKLTAITPATATGKEPTTAPTDLLLLGTALGSFRETFALIQKGSSREERVFRLGDTVFDIGPLVAVQKEYAEVQRNGQRLKILMPNAVGGATGGSGTASPAPALAPASGLAAQVGSGSYVIDQRALAASLDNIGQAMTDARLLPSMREGKVEGFRVSEVKPQGVFGMVGIRNGDLLQRINDFPIDSPEKAIQSLVSLKGQNRIKLDMIRDGQPTTFTYEIR